MSTRSPEQLNPVSEQPLPVDDILKTVQDLVATNSKALNILEMLAKQQVRVDTNASVTDTTKLRSPNSEAQTEDLGKDLQEIFGEINTPNPQPPKQKPAPTPPVVPPVEVPVPAAEMQVTVPTPPVVPPAKTPTMPANAPAETETPPAAVRVPKQRTGGFKKTKFIDPIAAIPKILLQGTKTLDTQQSTERPSVRTQTIAAGAAALTITGMMVSANEQEATVGAGCTDNTHVSANVGASRGPEIGPKDIVRLVVDKLSPYEDDRQWPELARQFSEEYGYEISANRLAAVNKNAKSMRDGKQRQLAEYNPDGSLKQNIRVVGEYCFAIPGPIVAGQAETGAGDTVKTLADRHMVQVAEIRKLNPNLPKGDNARLGAGKVVRISKQLDSSLVLQRVNNPDLRQYVDLDDEDAAETLSRILNANASALSQNGSPDARMMYLPLKQTESMKEQHVTPEAITANHATTDFGSPKPQTRRTPRVPESGNAPAPVESPQPDQPSSAAEFSKQIESLSLSPEQKATLVKIIEAIEAVPEADAKGVDLTVVLAQAISASKWGTTNLATQHNNFFNLPAKSGWKGDIAWMGSTNSSAKVKYRAYDSLQEGVNDFVKTIKSSPEYSAKRAQNGREDEAAIIGLYGKSVSNIRTALIFEYFADKGLTPEQIAGLVGNFQRESGINPSTLQTNGPAKGLAQWQGGRFTSLVKFAEERGESWTDFYTQLDFVWHEFNTPHTRENEAFEALKAATTVEEAARIVSDEYERPDPNPQTLRMDLRIRYSQDAMGLYKRIQAHKKTVLGLINQLTLDTLLHAAAAHAPSPKPAPKTPPHHEGMGPAPSGAETAPGNNKKRITLNPSKYSKVQNPLPPNMSKGAYVDADNNPATGVSGSEKRSRDLAYQERVKIVERELNEAYNQISPEGYKQFKAEDIRSKVKKDFAKNFDGQRTHLGRPEHPEEIEYFVYHFTATNTAVNDMSGYQLAQSMYNSGPLGINYNINNQGTAYFLTDDFTYHARNFEGTYYNGFSYGVEISSSEQSEINSEQYKAGIYLGVHYLIDNGFVTKDKPITHAVEERIRGHREVNAAVGMHHDFPGLVMDPIRQMIIDLLVDMGYTR